MEALIAEQWEIYEKIKKINVNFSKDGPGRKTSDYIKKRLNSLDEFWSIFDRNNTALEKEIKKEQRTDEYFTTDLYSSVHQFYLSTRLLVSSYPAKSNPIPKTPEQSEDEESDGRYSPPPHSPRRDHGANSKSDELLKKQASNFRAFARTVTNIDLKQLNAKWELEDTLRDLESRWKTVDSTHWELDNILEGSTNSIYEKAFTTHERTFHQMKKDINSKLWSISHREKFTPKIDVPVFNGTYQTWISFKDLFCEAIHNNPSMTDAQKMQFLKSKMRGEAERLLQHLTISTENYSTCWDILNNRYNNTKLIFNSHINTILELPNSKQQSVSHIKKIHDTANECLNAVKNLGVDTASWDPLIVHLLSLKLDTQTYNDYMDSVKQKRDLPTLNEFFEFLESKFTTLESSRRKQDGAQHQSSSTYYHNKPSSSSSGNYYQNSNYKFKRPPLANHVVTQQNSKHHISCPICGNAHRIFFCKVFLELNPFAKQKTIEKLNYCQNCLFDHYGQACFSTKKCRECNGNHNTILHDAFIKYRNPKPDSNTSKPNASTSEPPKQGNNSHVSQKRDVPEILLATAIINVQGIDGNYHQMRALIDQGSQLSLISEKAAQILSIPRQKCKGVVSGVGIKESNCKGQININCTSTDSSYSFSTDVLIMKQLIRNLPNYTFKKPSWEYLEHINLADPDFNISRPVDILLGAEVYSNIILEGICRSKQTMPIAQQTRLGWILCGSVTTLQCNVVLNNIERIEKFWEIEDIMEDSIASSEDFQCIKFYQETTRRREDGRYEVRLPMTTNFEQELGISKPKAIAQFLQIERKFERQENISKLYKQFINEYKSLGHMTPSTGNMKPECYLSHHCVLREGSTTTALRVVFNAKSKTSSGKSLNDLMARGPNLQQDLQSLILKWRQYKIAFTADIEKMFRQIWVHKDDQKLQKIIWRDCKTDPLREYQLSTVTYGTKAAPFLAMMTLKQLAIDERDNYQESGAAEVIEESFYMDDLIHGCHSLSEAKQLKQDLIKLLQAGGFNLRKWASNNLSLLQDDGTYQANQDNNFEFKLSESTKTLGLRWTPSQDNFTFESKINQENQSKQTKRTLLSEISKIFDPLGWLTPTTTKLKLLFQNVWQTDLKWDDELPQQILSEWLKIKADIKNINIIEVPRWLGTDQSTSIELHGYCDASTKAYACVIYCKVNIEPPKVVLVIAKSRVASQKKKHTLPRLELCGAELLSRVMGKVQQCLSKYNPQIFGWTDSTAVLGWIQGNPNKWKPFVAHRVCTITSIMGPKCWRYVKSTENPADCASRGILASQLTEHNLWWQGPKWLASYKVNNQTQVPIYETEEEVKKTKQVYVVFQQDGDDNLINQLIQKHSSLKKIVRILAWVRRFTCKKEEREKKSYLTVQEKEKAKQSIIKQIQQSEFKSEISSLKAEQKLDSKSKILSLNPFLDEQGILRVGGRLRHANLSNDMKNPIILPHGGRHTALLIEQAHDLTFHGGARLTLSYLRRKYWIIGGNRAIKTHLRSCVICRRHKPTKHDQIMGDLPASRTNPSRPFYHTGVDFTGHIEVKTNKGRGSKTTKGYIAVFLCMVTKAIHLELVSDMTSSAFLAALRRLASRRGTPGHIYSDNGTNFVGANNMLQQESINLKQILNTEFNNELSDMEIRWHFQAPSWPSAGGLWEAGVKSVKYHLRRVLGEQKLTYEEFYTLLSQLEACLNSRPLCAISEDPDDLDYLTPSHFLSSGPVLTIIETEKDQRTRWTLTQKIFNDVWQRWKVEYLTQLSARTKWKSSKNNIKINDIVLIHDANLPPGKWSMGRVVELHPGRDGYVRVVTLKTKNGLIKRPIVKLSLLPVSNQTTQATSKVEQVSQVTSSSEHDTRARRTRRRPNKANSSSYVTMIIMAVIYYLTIITSCFGQNVSTLPENQGLYFDKVSSMQLIRDEWKIVVYYDMYPYWDGTQAYILYSEHLESICKQLKQRTHCDVIMLQLDHMFHELQYYNEILLHKQVSARRRRGLINGIGSIARSLFGVLDDEFAEQYKRDIALINKNKNHIMQLWRNQTSIIEAEYNLLKRTKENIEKQHKIFNQHIIALEQAANKFQAEINNLEYVNEFILSALSAHNMIESLRETQNTLLDIITNIYNGKFNIHIITPKQLQNELNFISGQLKQELSLPVKNIQSDLQNIYHLLKIRAKMTDQYLIIEIKIPLISRDYYDLYHVLAVPKQVGQNMVTLLPIAEYVGINIQKDSYLPISHEELEQCIPHDASTYMCYLRRPIYKMKSDTDLCIKAENNQCRSNITSCTHQWTNLINTNTYFLFCCDICQLRTICGDHITASQLKHANIINLAENCIIKTDNFTVYAHKDLSSSLKLSPEIKKLDIPQINNIINVTFEPIKEKPLLNNMTQQLMNDLEQKIIKMKESNPSIENISTHDIHQYSAIYGILIVAIIVAIVIMCRRGRYCRKSSTEEATVRRQNTEQPPPSPESSRRRRSVASARPPTVSYNVELASRTSNRSVHKIDKATTPISKFKLRENTI